MDAVRDLRLKDQILPRTKWSLRNCDVPDHEERLRAHEERIHNHPCECGSGKRYVDCCIGRINQEQIELRHRRRLARRRRRAEVAA
jgi:hypothetical protein